MRGSWWAPGLGLTLCAAASPLQERKQAWGTKQFQQYIGMDVTSLLSVPVWIMEPFTILQKAAEIMEYTDLLDQADKCKDPNERCVAVDSQLAALKHSL